MEMWHYLKGSSIYTIINYEPTLKNNIRKQLKGILDELIVQGTAFEQFTFTMGAGPAVEAIHQLKDSYEKARYSIMQRLVMGTSRLIEESPLEQTPQKATEILAELNKPMEATIEVLDKDTLLESIHNVKIQISQFKEVTGDIIYSLVEQTWEMYLLHLRNNQFIHDVDELNKTFTDNVRQCSSVDDLFTYLSMMIEDLLETVIQDEKQKETRPIRMAKQYIQQNYMNAISLEEISHMVGFNSAYFSTLFKKVSGSNFVDYCSQVRMNKAKQLLRETNLSIAVICEQVGYQDIKHFTKTFKKKIGLKPNEFRKLYS